MPTSSLRRAGGSVMVTLPPLYLKEAGLRAGSTVSLEIRGETLTVRPARERATLKDILKSTPKPAARQRAPGWDELPPAGNEV